MLTVGDINSGAVIDRLKTESPDLILDHGTSIVGKEILEIPEMALNLHWGLSPYYRGTHCTEWALINWDPYNIGVTIHKLHRVIDGGDVLAQARAAITSNDSINAINMQLSKLGTDLVIQAVDALKAGKKLTFSKQDYSLGFLTQNRQWRVTLARQAEYLSSPPILETLLRHPSRKARLSIVNNLDVKLKI